VARVLIADDERNVRINLKRILEEERHECVTVAGFEELVELLKSERFDLILTDLELQGHKIVEEFSEQMTRTPTIIVTAQNVPEVAAQALKAGAVDYVSKPFSPSEIVEKVNEALSSRESPQKLTRRVEQLLKEGKKEQAEKVARKILANFPSRPEGHYCMGLILEDVNKELASRHYKVSLILDPGFKPAAERLKKTGVK